MWKLMFSLLLLTACEPFYRAVGIVDDNPVEEAIEAVIKVETGIDVDLTPTSPEVK